MRHTVQGIGMTSQRTRNRMVERLRGQGIRNENVLKAMAHIPRHLFMDEALASYAYEDKALPIGFGQTISQPYVVARMTEALLGDRALSRVLEIGTGSGYQAAVLSELVETVFTVERIRALHMQVRQRFRELKLNNIRARYSDGNMGWEQGAKFDGIIVTAAHAQVPMELFEQLEVGGRLVMPVGESESQDLRLFVRSSSGIEEVVLDRVKFVPLQEGSI